MIYTILNIIFSAFAIYLLKKNADFNRHSKDGIKPYDIHPAELNYLYLNFNYLNRAIMAELLELKRNKKIEIEKYTRPSRNLKIADTVVEYRFTLLDETNIKNHEALFLKNIFQNSKDVTTDELRNLSSKNDKFFNLQGSWVMSIEDELKREGYYESDEKKLYAKKIMLVGLCSLALGIITLHKDNFFGFFGLISALLIMIIGLNFFLGKSKKGQDVLNYYNNLRENFDSKTLTERELINLLAMGLTMEEFIPIYESQEKYDTIDLVVNATNQKGGSLFDDAILRGFMNFHEPTSKNSLDTNKIGKRIFDK
jgi:hypothetical protein